MATEVLSILTNRLEHERGAHWLSWLVRLGILAMVMWNQPDGMIALLTALNWPFWYIFIVMAIYGNFQLLYYFYFTRWITNEVGKTAVKIAVIGAEKLEAKAEAGDEAFQRDLQFIEKITLWISNIVSKANRDYFIQRFHQFTQKEHNKIEALKTGSLISAGFFAATPIPLARSLPAIAFGMAHLRKGLYAIMMGNTVRIFYMVGIWAWLKRLLGPNFKWAVVSFFVVSLVIMIKQMPHEAICKYVVEKFQSLDKHLEAKLSSMNERRIP